MEIAGESTTSPTGSAFFSLRGAADAGEASPLNVFTTLLALWLPVTPTAPTDHPQGNSVTGSGVVPTGADAARSPSRGTPLPSTVPVPPDMAGGQGVTPGNPRLAGEDVAVPRPVGTVPAFAIRPHDPPAPGAIFADPRVSGQAEPMVAAGVRAMPEEAITPFRRGLGDVPSMVERAAEASPKPAEPSVPFPPVPSATHSPRGMALTSAVPSSTAPEPPSADEGDAAGRPLPDSLVGAVDRTGVQPEAGARPADPASSGDPLAADAGEAVTSVRPPLGAPTVPANPTVASGDGASSFRPQRATEARPTLQAMPATLPTVIARAVAEGHRMLRVQLEPPALGQVEVLVRSTPGGRLQAVIRVQKAETLERLRALEGEFHEALGGGMNASASVPVRFVLADEGEGERQGRDGAAADRRVVPARSAAAEAFAHTLERLFDVRI